MAQETIVLVLDEGERGTLMSALERGAFTFRSVPHALFSARGEGVTATLYGSGKLVVQGVEPELFAQRHLGRGPEKAPKGAANDLETLESGPLVGSDEAGKGDWFGPLVVAAVRLEPGDARALRQGGVGDSKQIDDRRIRVLAAGLRQRFEHSIQVLDPPEYNALHEERRNLNPMLAELHARAIREIVRPGDEVLVDQFAKPELLRKVLPELGDRLHQRTRAERAMAVAAASILARDAFVERLVELSDAFGVDLRKGAGAPTDAAGRRFLAIHPAERLREVAKLHFKNTTKVVGR